MEVLTLGLLGLTVVPALVLLTTDAEIQKPEALSNSTR